MRVIDSKADDVAKRLMTRLDREETGSVDDESEEEETPVVAITPKRKRPTSNDDTDWSSALEVVKKAIKEMKTHRSIMNDVDAYIEMNWNPTSPERVPDQFRRLEQEAEANMSNAETNYKTIRARLDKLRNMLNDALGDE